MMATETNEVLVPEPKIAVLQMDIQRILKELKDLEKRRFNEIEIALWKVKAQTQLQEYNKLKSRWNNWGEGMLQNIQHQKSQNSILRDENSVLTSKVEQLSCEVDKIKNLFILHGFPLTEPVTEKSNVVEKRCQANLSKEKLDELRRDLSLSECSEDGTSEITGNTTPNPSSSCDLVSPAPEHATDLPRFYVSYSINGVETQFSVQALEKSQHIQTTQYACEDCGRIYKGPKQLNKHVKYEHNAKTLTCKNVSKGCSYKTNRPWDLTRHQRSCDVGTNAAPHECTECRQKFSYMKRLVSHYHSKHPDLPLDTKFKYM